MKKGILWFEHDHNARNDSKILDLRCEYGWEGYGLYWAIVELLSAASEYKIKNSSVKGIALSINCEGEWLNSFVDKCCELELFKRTDNFFWSPSLLNRMKKFKLNSQKHSDAGKVGAKARWEKHAQKQQPKNAIALQSNSVGNAIDMPLESDVNATKMQHDNTGHDSTNTSSYSSSSSNSPKKGRRQLLPMLETCRNGSSTPESLSLLLEYLNFLIRETKTVNFANAIPYFKKNKKVLNDVTIISAEVTSWKKKNGRNPVIDIKEYAIGIRRNILNGSSEPDEIIQDLEIYTDKTTKKAATMWFNSQVDSIRETQPGLQADEVVRLANEKMTECPYTV